LEASGKDKKDLFEAVVETRRRPIAPLKRGATLREHLRCWASRWWAAIPARRAQALAALSFHTYALTHEPLRDGIAQLNEESYHRASARLLEHIAPSDLPMPPEQFVRVRHALADGLSFFGSFSRS
jgi:hypothetical protein